MIRHNGMLEKESATNQQVSVKCCILWNSYPSSTKSRSPVSPRGGSVTRGESSDSETGVEARRSWSPTSEHSLRTSKKPSSAGSFRRRGPQHIKRTASMDSIDFLHLIPSASDGKGLSEKVGAYHSV